MSIVPFPLLNHPVKPANPNPAGVELTLSGSDTLAALAAPPPEIVTWLGTVGEAPGTSIAIAIDWTPIEPSLSPGSIAGSSAGMFVHLTTVVPVHFHRSCTTLSNSLPPASVAFTPPGSVSVTVTGSLEGAAPML